MQRAAQSLGLVSNWIVVVILFLSGLVPAKSSAVQICQFGVCDGEGDPGQVLDEKVLSRCPRDTSVPSICGTVRIELHVSETYGMGWASIENVLPGTRVWIDRSFDPSRADEPGRREQLGISTVPLGQTGWRTMMYFYAPGIAQIRACGDPGGRALCTGWLPVCDGANCDGKDPAGAREREINPQAFVWGRKITLHVSDDSRMAWVSIENGQAGDTAWIDRSWSDGSDWDAQLGYAVIPNGASAWRGWMFHFNDRPHAGAGLLRACGRAGDRPQTVCTRWIRAAERAPADIHGAAVDALVARYDMARGTWRSPNSVAWWWPPNSLVAVVDYMIRTGDRRHEWLVDHMLTKLSRQDRSLPPGQYKNFVNDYIDDSGWWGLTWVRAYDLTGERRYLDVARSIADWMWRKGWDLQKCNGGLLWQQDPPLVWPERSENRAKNAITNELFIKLAASLHNRIPGDSEHLRRARMVWDWFKTSGLLAGPGGLVWDGLYSDELSHVDCKGFWTFSYSQGVLLGALVELQRALPPPGLLPERSLLDIADAVANAAINVNAPAETTFVFTAGHPYEGVLSEICEQQRKGCIKCERGVEPCRTIVIDPTDDDVVMFKGIFVRNLRELYEENLARGRSTYNWAQFFRTQTASLTANARSNWAEFGFRWTGPRGLAPIGAATDIHYSTQTAAVDAFNAASGL